MRTSCVCVDVCDCRWVSYAARWHRSGRDRKSVASSWVHWRQRRPALRDGDSTLCSVLIPNITELMLNRFSDLLIRLPFSLEGRSLIPAVGAGEPIAPKSKYDIQRVTQYQCCPCGMQRMERAQGCTHLWFPSKAGSCSCIRLLRSVAWESDSSHSCLSHHELRYNTKYQVYGIHRRWCLSQPPCWTVEEHHLAPLP